MNNTRREFLQTSMAAATFFGLGAAASGITPQTKVTSAASGKPLKILILGGTRFLGPALVEAAIARGHELTLFNRGRSNPHLFPEIEKLIGNRDPKLDEGLDTLKGRTWDAVVDTSGYYPRHVSASARLLAESVDQYVFISSFLVYADPSQSGIDELARLGTIDDPSLEQLTNATYGPLKALCEREVEAALPGQATNIRPGLIVGPRDPFDRFTYWPVRIAQGGEVLAPNTGHDPVQLIDVRDLADYTITCLENNHTGAFNAVGPECRMTMAEMLHGCKAVTGGCALLTWVPTEFLARHEVSPWEDMPVWFPQDDKSAGFSTLSNARGLATGLAFRPFAETAKDTLDWFATLPQERRGNLRFGIKAEREREVLEAWHQQNRS